VVCGIEMYKAMVVFGVVGNNESLFYSCVGVGNPIMFRVGKQENVWFRYHMMTDGAWKISRGCFTRTYVVVCILKVCWT
jgi:hypothetical protein